MTALTTITLTPEQEEAIVAPYRAEFKKQLAREVADVARKGKALQRRTDARVERARQTAKKWKVQYAETRSKLLAAQGEIVHLKRRLRDGEWWE